MRANRTSFSSPGHNCGGCDEHKLGIERDPEALITPMNLAEKFWASLSSPHNKEILLSLEELLLAIVPSMNPWVDACRQGSLITRLKSQVETGHKTVLFGPHVNMIVIILDFYFLLWYNFTKGNAHTLTTLNTDNFITSKSFLMFLSGQKLTVPCKSNHYYYFYHHMLVFGILDLHRKEIYKYALFCV